MKHYYRCDNCQRLITMKTVRAKGECSKCGSRKLKYAYYRGFNMPKPWEFILLALGLR